MEVTEMVPMLWKELAEVRAEELMAEACRDAVARAAEVGARRPGAAGRLLAAALRRAADRLDAGAVTQPNC
jgi:hypothetical protein